MRLYRRSRLLSLHLTGGKITKMSQERQKLSFFIVVIFLAVFGLIVLAEVLFVENGRDGRDGLGLFDDLPKLPTPKPPRLPRGRQQQQQKVKVNTQQKSLQMHEDEMEMLIQNISAHMRASVESVKLLTTQPPMPPQRPFDYSRELLPLDAFDFTLQKHDGLDGVWQPVHGTMSKFYVYSAYYDARSGHRLVRVIGVTRTKSREKVWCRFFHKGEAGSGLHSPPRVVRVAATVSVIRENWNLKFSAVFVICPLPPSDKSIPQSVSVIASREDSKTASNQLRVLNVNPDLDKLTNSEEVGVCVKPIHFNYSQTLELIEFIELNQLLGVTKFTLYNDTISPQSGCVLQEYADSGVAQVLPWRLNVESQTEIRTEGLFAALNDCLYRNMYRFNYLMLIDFDEFVVPKQNKTLPEMLKFLNTQKSSQVPLNKGGGPVMARRAKPRVTSSYSFQNAFFYLQFPDDDEQNALPLRVLRKTRRKSKFNPQKQRSKYICVPRRVKEAGNHFIWEYAEGYNVNVSPSVGFLHHYRVCEFGGDDCVRTESKVDRTLKDRFADELVKNVREVGDRLMDKCRLQDLLVQSANSTLVM